MNTRDKIHSAINEHIDIEDTYAYFLTRDKSSFSVGTVTLDDFEEWTDSDVADLTDSIMEKINTELNENQQVVFEQLCLIYDKQIYKSKMQAIYIFINEGMSEEFLMLNKKESDQVLAAFSKEVAE